MKDRRCDGKLTLKVADNIEVSVLVYALFFRSVCFDKHFIETMLILDYLFYEKICNVNVYVMKAVDLKFTFNMFLCKWILFRITIYGDE